MNIYRKIIQILLDALDEHDEELTRRVAELEAWKEQVEAVWPEVNDGTD